jgi:hypothetical protein
MRSYNIMSLDQTGHPTRRCFLRTACLAGLGVCATTATAAPTGGADPPAAGEPGALPRAWIAALLPGLAAGDPAEARRVLRGCAVAHFHQLSMSTVLAPFRQDLPAFLDFLRREWSWIVVHDQDTNEVLVDENKDHCVCPLLTAAPGPEVGVLCYCSEGFAEAMFTVVMGAPAAAEVTSSILRGDDRCRYHIRLT